MPHETESPLEVIYEDDIVIGITFQKTVPDVLHKKIFVRNSDHVKLTVPDTINKQHKALFPTATLIKDAAYGLSFIVKK